MMYGRTLCLTLLCFAASGVTALSRATDASTPVARVVELLQRLSGQIASEGKTEAAEYDKYACFCKEQASDKIYNIERSDEKIKNLNAKIEKLDAEITQLNTDITALGEDIAELETKISDKEAERAEEHEAYLTADANHTDAISALEEAIEVLRASKKDMKNAKTDFAQLQANPKFAKVSALVAAAAVQKPHAYEYKSNDIIGTLQELLIDFKAAKKDTDVAEHEAKAASETTVLGWSNEKKFKEEDKMEKETLVGEKSDEKAEKTGDMEAETKARDADESFKEELMTQCEDKAAEFDQRSKTRSAELTAIASAIDTLKSGVESNYAANDKLVGLTQLRSARPISLLQLSGDATGTAGAAIARVSEQLEGAATQLGSPTLSTLAAKVVLQGDHFAKVVGLINDLIKKLEAEATSEAESKTFCDEGLGKAVGSRDEQKIAIEENTAKIASKEAEKAQLTEDIEVLSKEIAEEQKALSEATELRAEEKAANEKTLADAGEGKVAVQQAITVLSDFYNSFVQVKSAGPDRDGKTFEDLAPETSYSGDYTGKGEQGTGIIGILGVIKSDFERTETTVGEAETAAQAAFEEFETSTKASITAKDDEQKEKRSSITTAEEEITQAKDAVMSAKKLLDGSLEELEKLKVMCVEGEDSFEERKKKREQEIEALKGALKILEDWK